jgi:hypothetical protein
MADVTSSGSPSNQLGARPSVFPPSACVAREAHKRRATKRLVIGKIAVRASRLVCAAEHERRAPVIPDSNFVPAVPGLIAIDLRLYYTIVKIRRSVARPKHRILILIVTG